MKTWKEKALIPPYGECIVKEATDKEANGKIAPSSHGFVNLYQNGKWIDFCGILFAKNRIIKKTRSEKVSEKALHNFYKSVSLVGDFIYVCQEYGIKVDELERIIRFNFGESQKYTNVDMEISQKRLSEIKDLLKSLSEIVKKESISPWLHKKNIVFNKLTPLEFIEIQGTNEIWSMIYQLSETTGT